MRPRLEGDCASKVIELVNENYPHLSPTQLIQQLIETHYNTLYPRGDNTDDNTTEKTKVSNS